MTAQDPIKTQVIGLWRSSTAGIIAANIPRSDQDRVKGIRYLAQFFIRDLTYMKPEIHVALGASYAEALIVWILEDHGYAECAADAGEPGELQER